MDEEVWTLLLQSPAIRRELERRHRVTLDNLRATGQDFDEEALTKAFELMISKPPTKPSSAAQDAVEWTIIPLKNGNYTGVS